MSDNVIQSIEKVLTQQNNDLTQDEIEIICDRFSKKENPGKVRRALTDDLEEKEARASLEGMMMFWVGDLDLAAKVVAGSETTPKNTEIEAEKSVISHRDRNWGKDRNGWDRYSDATTSDTTPDSSDPVDDRKETTNGSSSQNVPSGNGRYYDEFDMKKQETMHDLFGK